MLLNYQQKQPYLNVKAQKYENIFIIHGLFGSLSNLSGLATTLQKSHRVTAVDLRNHGKSPHSPTMSYPQMANDIFELADHLDITNFSIVGHSMGGKVAMTCALLQPQRINKVVVVDIAPISYANKHKNVLKGVQALAEKPIKSRQSADAILSQYIERVEVRQFLLKSLIRKGDDYQLQFNIDAIIKNYDFIRSWPTLNNRFTKEVFFIKGENSDYLLPKYQTAILQLFPQAKAKIISNSGHWLHTEKAATFNRLVSNFFN